MGDLDILLGGSCHKLEDLVPQGKCRYRGKLPPFLVWGKAGKLWGMKAGEGKEAFPELGQTAWGGRWGR